MPRKAIKIPAVLHLGRMMIFTAPIMVATVDVFNASESKLSKLNLYFFPGADVNRHEFDSRLAGLPDCHINAMAILYAPLSMNFRVGKTRRENLFRICGPLLNPKTFLSARR